MVFQFTANIEEFDASGNPLPTGKGETYANDNLFGVTLPPTPYPVPALQLAPMLRYNEILTIEMMAQHVVRNTTRYSKAVWASLTDEERAILLDQYTIGVPPNGIADASQMIPLLDCVQNKVLGFFGNSMILPFSIPQSVTDAINQQQQAARAPARRRSRRRSTRCRSSSRFWPISSRASFRPSRSSRCRREASWAKRCSATARRARSST